MELERCYRCSNYSPILGPWNKLQTLSCGSEQLSRWASRLSSLAMTSFKRSVTPHVVSNFFHVVMNAKRSSLGFSSFKNCPIEMVGRMSHTALRVGRPNVESQ